MKSIQFRIRPDCSQITQVLQAHYYTRIIRKGLEGLKAVIMSYTDDAVKAKLSALNETQDSIVTVAQWIMFHRYVDQCCCLLLHLHAQLTLNLCRRYADRTAQLWLTRIKDSGSNKRLNLIYLVNEVAQQSKARKKDDFLNAFSPIMPEASAIAYKGATHEVQNRLRRVFEVWRQRQIFENAIQDAVEARINGMSCEQPRKPSELSE